MILHKVSPMEGSGLVITGKMARKSKRNVIKGTRASRFFQIDQSSIAEGKLLKLPSLPEEYIFDTLPISFDTARRTNSEGVLRLY